MLTRMARLLTRMARMARMARMLTRMTRWLAYYTYSANLLVLGRFFFSGVDGFSPTDSCQKLKSHGRVSLVKHLAKLPLSGRCDYEKT